MGRSALGSRHDVLCRSGQTRYVEEEIIGCDVHPFFETRDADGRWGLTFPRRPDEYWFEELLYEKVEDGSAVTIFGPPTDEEIAAALQDKQLTRDAAIEHVLVEKLRAHFLGMTDEDIVERYSNEPSFVWEYFPAEACNNFGSAAITSRNYHWFAKICGPSVESRFIPEAEEFFKDLSPMPERGIPDDLTPEVAGEFERYSGDGHSHSWLMVSEILADENFRTMPNDGRNFPQYDWLRDFIPDPENTRMVFFFDN